MLLQVKQLSVDFAWIRPTITLSVLSLLQATTAQSWIVDLSQGSTLGYPRCSKLQHHCLLHFLVRVVQETTAEPKKEHEHHLEHEDGELHEFNETAHLVELEAEEEEEHVHEEDLKLRNNYRKKVKGDYNWF